ncbi:MAG: hypothetical protein AAFR52_04795 [Pseudomonadota bacterium]
MKVSIQPWDAEREGQAGLTEFTFRVSITYENRAEAGPVTLGLRLWEGATEADDGLAILDPRTGAQAKSAILRAPAPDDAIFGDDPDAPAVEHGFVTVVWTGDGVFEPTEVFGLQIARAEPADQVLIESGLASGWIRNDDQPGDGGVSMADMLREKIADADKIIAAMETTELSEVDAIDQVKWDIVNIIEAGRDDDERKLDKLENGDDDEHYVIDDPTAPVPEAELDAALQDLLGIPDAPPEDPEPGEDSFELVLCDDHAPAGEDAPDLPPLEDDWTDCAGDFLDFG